MRLKSPWDLVREWRKMLLEDALSPREMKAVEMNAEYLGVSKLQMMENAGAAVAKAVIDGFGGKSKVAVVCGLGGNGGDGFVAARHLAAAEYPVQVMLLGRHLNIHSQEAKHNWRTLSQMGHTVETVEIHDSAEIPPLEADVIVDALIGTGARGALSSPYRQMVEAINGARGFKIAVDIPTGVESDTGETRGAAVSADLTLTFHKPKTGLAKNGAHVGRLKTCPIGVPPEAERYAGPGDVFLAMRERPPDAHKGDFGRLLVIGGNDTYTGAPALTAMGAYATGIDLAYAAAPETAASIIAGFSPSLIAVRLKGSRLNAGSLDKLRTFYERVDAVAIGPGLGLHGETVEAVGAIVEEVEERRLPVLLDADALKSYPQGKKILSPAVFTPHAKEFEILTGKTLKGGLEERGERVRKEAARLGGTILLKGSVDVASDGKYVRYNQTGNPGMTVGGTGDVLSGIVAGFMAMGSRPLQAAVAGAFVNGAAGDAALREKGYHLEPMDLIREIPRVVEDALAGRMRASPLGS